LGARAILVATISLTILSDRPGESMDEADDLLYVLISGVGSVVWRHVAEEWEAGGLCPETIDHASAQPLIGPAES